MVKNMRVHFVCGVQDNGTARYLGAHNLDITHRLLGTKIPLAAAVQPCPILHQWLWVPLSACDTQPSDDSEKPKRNKNKERTHSLCL